ncbi:MAG TPA: hypothetical protein VHP36_09575 [Chitinispirillaceae bacterium]|nr:hypothetical protein [Chitinispirillaceae bacterium]
MTRMILQISTMYLLIIFSSLSSAQDSVKTTFMFWSRITMGQVIKSTLENTGYDIPFDKEWLELIDGGIKITRQLTPSLTGRLNLGVVINVATVNPKGFTTSEYAVKKVAPALLDACLEYRSRGFLLELGYFPFKYNPQSTNLGEYLFRSGTYPGWLISGFEHSIDKPKLAGVHVSHTFGSTFSLKQDLIINTEIDVYPYRDINLTYIATPSLKKIIDIGLGVELTRLITVDPKKTTIGLDPIYNNKYDPKIGYIDKTTGDTILYTFRGTKLMARATFDFKELIRELSGTDAAIFGKEDLKFYGEAAWLGVKNYPGWYDKPEERVPMMIGFNLPAFKVLDRLSIEVERYMSPYINAQDYIWKGTTAVPYIAGRPSGSSYPLYDRDWNDSLAVHDDDIRWSIYAMKNIGKHVRLSAQAACDHTPKNWYTPWPAPQSAKYNDMVWKTSDWYLMMRMSIFF